MTFGKRLTYEQALAKYGKKRNKFNATRSSLDDVVYDSQLERDFAIHLNLQLRAKLIKGWTRQKKIDLYYYNSQGRKHPWKSWKVDFMIEHLNGKFELAEVKGLATGDYLLKKEICQNVWLPDNPNYSLKVYRKGDF